MKLAALVLMLLAAFAPAFAVNPPDRVNYQGVLRDASDNPRNGSFDMTFRFFDAAGGGNEILVDRHLAAGTGAVVVSAGLFEVDLGGGAVSDGAAPLPGDPYATLAAMFEDFADVWLQIEIGVEVLSPRVHVTAAPYALHARTAVAADSALTSASASTASNALALGGIAASGFLNTSASFQTKAGSLMVGGTLTAGGNALTFGHPGALLTAGAEFLQVRAGDQPTDNLVLTNATGSSMIYIAGNGPTDFYAGDGNFTFFNGTSIVPKASINNLGDVTGAGNLIAGNGSAVLGSNDLRFITAGNAGLTATPTNLELRSNTGSFSFANATTGATNASLSSFGTFTATEDLVASGNDLRFGAPGARLTALPYGLAVLAGDADDDNLYLDAGNDLSDGSIDIHGNGSIDFRSGNGLFRFLDGVTGTVTASLDFTGTLAATGDLIASGNDLGFGVAGALLTATTGNLQLTAGDLDGDDLLLHAGNDSTDGSIDIFGDNAIVLRAGNGTVTFINGATAGILAVLDASATFTSNGDLVAGGSEVHLGPPGSTRMVRNPVTDDLYFARDEDQNNAASTFSIFTNVGITQMRINDGDEAPAFFDGSVNANGLDYAEAFSISDPTLVAGDVVVFDPARPGFIARAAESYSSLLAGVVSGKPGFLTGGSFDAEEAADPALAVDMLAAYKAGAYEAAKEIALVLEQKKTERQRAVALAGRLPVKVDATHGPIKAGDHLTSSPTPGHAMAMREAGPSIGVALESWSGPGPGVILAFVQRGHYTPPSLLAETRATQDRLAASLAGRTPDPATGVQVLPSNMQLVLDATGDQESRFSIFRDGQPSEPRAEVFRVDERGNVWAQGAFRPRSMDLAEAFAVGEPVEPGDVLVVDREHPGRYVRSRQAGDPAVVGVVATDPGVLLGGDVSRLLGESPELAEALAEARSGRDRKAEQEVWAEVERRFRASHAPVALSGTVLVKVDAGYGAIEPGDLLVASPTPGHAMRAVEPATGGSVIGKALESFERGVGAIRMIVMLR